jgi:two-component system nitrogen regulation response regulator GlnG
MAPAQLVDAKDLPPELQPQAARTVAAVPGAPAGVVAAQEAIGRAGETATAAAAPAVRPAGEPAAASSSGSSSDSAEPVDAGWLSGLEQEARQLLRAGEPMVWDTLTRRFEGQLIHTALEITRGRRIEAAQKLGIGRNTITRKIQELGLEEK